MQRKRFSRAITTMLAVVCLSLPCSGCAQGRGGDPMGALFKTALGIGAALGTYWVVDQLK